MTRGGASAFQRPTLPDESRSLTTSSAKLAGCSTILVYRGTKLSFAFHETERPVRTATVNQVREPIYRTSSSR